jgi:putative nucleotidyltransferase with HDIG domain
MPVAVRAMAAGIVREPWDAAPASPAQERFQRELLAMGNLPSPPEVAQRVLATANREDADVRQLAALISCDQALAARLLRLANGALFAVRSRVTAIGQAVALLGVGRVRDLVLGLAVWGGFAGATGSGRRHAHALWLHAAMVAATAKLLAERGRLDAGAAFTAGLLHDIGKLVFGLRLGDSYWALVDDAGERGAPLATVETETFGCHHATVAGWLLQLWQLPPELVGAVARHHDALDAAYGFDVTAAVALANRLVAATDPRSGTLVAPDTAAELAGLAPDLAPDWPAVHARLASERDAVASLFAA